MIRFVSPLWLFVVGVGGYVLAQAVALGLAGPLRPTTAFGGAYVALCTVLVLFNRVTTSPALTPYSPFVWPSGDLPRGEAGQVMLPAAAADGFEAAMKQVNRFYFVHFIYLFFLVTVGYVLAIMLGWSLFRPGVVAYVETWRPLFDGLVPLVPIAARYTTLFGDPQVPPNIAVVQHLYVWVWGLVPLAALICVLRFRVWVRAWQNLDTRPWPKDALRTAPIAVVVCLASGIACLISAYLGLWYAGSDVERAVEPSYALRMSVTLSVGIMFLLTVLVGLAARLQAAPGAPSR